jgi:hypothetical protein
LEGNSREGSSWEMHHIKGLDISYTSWYVQTWNFRWMWVYKLLFL